MSSEKQIDDYIDGLEEKNQIYVEKELEYADKCHNLEEEIGCNLDVIFKALKQDYVYTNAGKRGRLAIGFYGDFLALFYGKYEMLRVGNYKKTWWLKEDKSE